MEDALSQGVVPDAIFSTPHLLETTQRGANLARWLRGQDVPHFEISERLLTLISDTETPSGIIVVASLPPITSILPRPQYRGLGALLLDQVRDPGNIGGILRTAAAAGVSVVVSTEGSADLWAPKVVRAGAGAHFRLTLAAGIPVADVVEWLREWEQAILADGRTERTIYDLDWRRSTVLVMSNEAHGPSNWLPEVAPIRARIPMRANTESLNVAAAAAIIVYEAQRDLLRTR